MAKKRKMPAERTLERLRELGITCDKVERWIVAPNLPGGGVRKDLFGGIDIIALDGGIVGIQCTSYAGRKKHLDSMLLNPKLVEWLHYGGRLELWSWRQRGKNWEPVIDKIVLPGAS